MKRYIIHNVDSYMLIVRVKNEPMRIDFDKKMSFPGLPPFCYYDTSDKEVQQAIENYYMFGSFIQVFNEKTNTATTTEETKYAELEAKYAELEAKYAELEAILGETAKKDGSPCSPEKGYSAEFAFEPTEDDIEGVTSVNKAKALLNRLLPDQTEIIKELKSVEETKSYAATLGLTFENWK